MPTLEDTIGDGTDLDGVFICCGKNEDDRPLIAEIADRFARGGCKDAFICHLSTVSSGFATAAHAHCRKKAVHYLNYPLTGGPAGAEAGTMLILASGDHALFQRLEPALNCLGTPRYFGDRPAAAAEVKLMGHLMVFNGLIGICSAVAVHTERFNDGQIGGDDQVAFF